MIRFTLNGSEYGFAGADDTPLRWVIRESAGLTGTKYGCGTGQCRACTVHVDGKARRACVTDVKAVTGRAVTTIEGLSHDDSHPVQKAWLETNVAQCGYCQSGQIMSAVALLEKNPAPTDADIDEAMSGNLCRCGTYNQVREAIREAAAALKA